MAWWWTLGALALFVLPAHLAPYSQADDAGFNRAADSRAHSRETKIGGSARAHFAAESHFAFWFRTRSVFIWKNDFNFRAPERTTEEFLRELAGTDLLWPEQKESLGKFLESCDLVKFAKYEPGENELRELHASAVKLVEETEPKEISNSEKLATVGEERQKNRKSVKSKMVVCPSIFFSAASIAASARVAERQARFAAGISLFVCETGRRFGARGVRTPEIFSPRCAG
jgi:hypothetical protein